MNCAALVKVSTGQKLGLTCTLTGTAAESTEKVKADFSDCKSERS